MIQSILAIAIMLYIMNNANQSDEPQLESEQPPISEFGELDDGSWGKIS